MDPADGQVEPRTALYDRIGVGYDDTRRADPGLADALHLHLGPASGPTLDLACGTGNYTFAPAARGREIVSLDRSPLMLARARQKATRPWIQGDVARLPFADAGFAALLCNLAIHHFPDRQRACVEMGRVLAPGGRLVIFTDFPEQIRNYWLNAYFPRALQRAAKSMPSEAEIEDILAAAGFGPPRVVPWLVTPDLVDLFMYAGKQRPELYFDAAVRRGISTFANQAEAAEIEDGLARLRADLDNGRFEAVAAAYDSDAGGDYSFMIAEKGAL